MIFTAAKMKNQNNLHRYFPKSDNMLNFEAYKDEFAGLFLEVHLMVQHSKLPKYKAFMNL